MIAKALTSSPWLGDLWSYEQPQPWGREALIERLTPQWEPGVQAHDFLRERQSPLGLSSQEVGHVGRGR